MAEPPQYDAVPLRDGATDKKDDDKQGVKLEAKMSLLNGITVRRGLGPVMAWAGNGRGGARWDGTR